MNEARNQPERGFQTDVRQETNVFGVREVDIRDVEPSKLLSKRCT